MNILIMSWRGPKHPNAGGAEQVTFEHAKGWMKAGHRVTLFTSTFDGAKDEETVDGIKIVRGGNQEFGVKVMGLGWYFFGNHSNFDLVVDEFHGLPFFTPLYVTSKKLAFIHEVAKEVWWMNPWLKPFNLIPGILGTLFEPFIFRLFYKNVDFMTVSISTRSDLILWDIPSDNITVVPNGVNLIEIPNQLPKKESKKTAMFLGALSDDKGIFDVVKFFYELNKIDREWQFWVAGEGTKEYFDRLKRLAKDLGIGGKVDFFGYVSEKKKFDLLARAHVLVNPSVHEGWGLVNIEANAVGTPVVGYRVQGIKDSVVDGTTGILVDKFDFKSLAKRSSELVNNKVLYKRMQIECKKWAKKFDWESSQRKSLKLIESL